VKLINVSIHGTYLHIFCLKTPNSTAPGYVIRKSPLQTVLNLYIKVLKVLKTQTWIEMFWCCST